jgi:hypothetical protein
MAMGSYWALHCQCARPAGGTPKNKALRPVGAIISYARIDKLELGNESEKLELGNE